jgi:basic membrane protein A and related proteins
MTGKKFLIGLIAVIVLLGACTPQTADEVAPEEVNQVKIAFFGGDSIDEPWSQSMVLAVERVIDQGYLDLDIQYQWFENVPTADYEKFVRDVIVTNEFDIIWLHDAAAGPDPIDNLKAEFPQQLIAVTASNYRPVGGNAYWLQTYAHEPAYLTGIIAGMMTETDTLGVTAGFPFASVNHVLQAFKAGATSVNPDVRVLVSYIEAWWDPVKAKETALAQIEQGADLIYADRFGAHEAARDMGVLAFGHQTDIYHMAPETIITSPLVFWDASIRFILGEWYQFKTEGVPYNAPEGEPSFFLMREGGSDIAPLYDWEEKLPQEVLDQFYSVKEGIMDGSFTVELNLSPLESD